MSHDPREEIAGHKPDEQTLRDSESRFRSVTESANDAIIAADNSGEIVSWNSGAGIGLTSSRQAIEQHGGTLIVQSKEGVGSTFTARLPLSPLDSH